MIVVVQVSRLLLSTAAVCRTRALLTPPPKRSSETHRPGGFPNNQATTSVAYLTNDGFLLQFGCSREAVRFPGLLLLHSTFGAYVAVQRHIRGPAWPC
jgi:hypothetical protein